MPFNIKKKKQLKKTLKKRVNASRSLTTTTIAISQPTKAKQVIAGVTATQHGWIVKHSEFVSSIVGTNEFSTGSMALMINPGNGTLFPWLKGIAINFEKYKIRKLTVKYRPIAATTVTGQIAMFIDYDGRDPPPATLPPLLNSCDAVDGAVYTKLDLPYKKTYEIAKEYLISSNTSNTNTFVPSESVGILYMATQDCSVVTAIGNIFVDYEIELLVPQGTPVTSASLPEDEVSFNTPVAAFPAAGTVPILQSIHERVVAIGEEGNYFDDGISLLQNYREHGHAVTDNTIFDMRPYDEFTTWNMAPVTGSVGNAKSLGAVGMVFQKAGDYLIDIVAAIKPTAQSGANFAGIETFHIAKGSPLTSSNTKINYMAVTANGLWYSMKAWISAIGDFGLLNFITTMNRVDASTTTGPVAYNSFAMAVKKINSGMDAIKAFVGAIAGPLNDTLHIVNDMRLSPHDVDRICRISPAVDKKHASPYQRYLYDLQCLEVNNENDSSDDDPITPPPTPKPLSSKALSQAFRRVQFE